MSDERSLKGSLQYLFLVIDKRLYAFPFQSTDCTGAHIHYLFVFVCHLLLYQTLTNTLSFSLIKEAQEQVGSLLKRQ